MQSNTKRFHLDDLTRIPVVISEEAKEMIIASSKQGRLWPQALSELCGEMGCISAIAIDVVAKSTFHTVHPSELHPQTGAEPLLYHVIATHVVDGVPPYEWLINTTDLIQVYPRGDFQAVTSVQEMLAQYPYR